MVLPLPSQCGIFAYRKNVVSVLCRSILPAAVIACSVGYACLFVSLFETVVLTRANPRVRTLIEVFAEVPGGAGAFRELKFGEAERPLGP